MAATFTATRMLFLLLLGVIVDRFGDEFFARSGLAGDRNGDVICYCLLEQRECFLDSRAVADNALAKLILGRDLFLEHVDLAYEAVLVACVVDRIKDAILCILVFGDVVECPCFK